MQRSVSHVQAPRAHAASQPLPFRRCPLSVQATKATQPQQKQQLKHQQKHTAALDTEDRGSMAALPVASLLAAALLAAPLVAPTEAFAARSSGRAGGTSGFSARRMEAPPSRSSVRTQAAPSTSNTVVIAPSPYYASPFGFSPFGFSPFGGFGFGYSTGVSVGLPFGGLFSFLALILTVSVVFNIISSFVKSSGGGKKKDGEDGWGDL